MTKALTIALAAMLITGPSLLVGAGEATPPPAAEPVTRHETEPQITSQRGTTAGVGADAVERVAPGSVRRIAPGDVHVESRPAAMSLLGSVCDTTGRGVAGAEITVCVWSRILPRTVTANAVGGYPEGAVTRAMSDTDGSFAVRAIGSDGNTFEVVVTCPGFAACSMTVPVEPLPEIILPDITLRRANTVRGRVADPHGAPIEGAVVCFDVAGAALATAMRGARLHRAPTTSTDEHGRFELTGAPSEAFRLAVEAAGYLLLRTEEITANDCDDTLVGVLTMHRRLQLEGVVVDEHTGTPIELFGFRVRPAAADSAAPCHHRRSRLGASGLTTFRTPEPTHHDAGAFVAPGLAAGDHVLEFDAPGYARTAIGPITLEHGTRSAPLTVALPRAPAVRGIVVGPDGAPVPGARVELFVPAETSSKGTDDFRRLFAGERGIDHGTRVATARTGLDGRFDLGGHRAGRFRLVAAAFDRPPHIDDTVILDSTDLDLRVPMTDGSRLFGHVDGVGGRLSRVTVLGPDGARRNESVDADGNYEFRGLAAGTYRVWLEADDIPGSRGANQHVRVAAGAGVRHDLDGAALAAASVLGVVLESGVPARGRYVLLTPRASDAKTHHSSADVLAMRTRRASVDPMRIETDDTGSFEFGAVPPGAYTLEVRHRDGTHPDSTHTERIELTPGQRWRGTIGVAARRRIDD